jgi:hypothetical protein
LLKLFLIGSALVATTVAIHAAGSTAWLRFVVARYLTEDGAWGGRSSMVAITSTVIVLISLHALQITVWATAYRALVPTGELATFEEALYFSFVTFTTLGYGDITLSEGWRLLSGIQALNGILLVGWTTALLFAIVQRTWRT